MKNIILSVINIATENELELHFSTMQKCCNTIDSLAKTLKLTTTAICKTEIGTEAYYISPFGKFKLLITAIEMDEPATVSDLNFLVQKKPYHIEEIEQFIKELTKRQTKKQPKAMMVRLTGNNLGSGYIVRKMTESDIYEALANGFTVEKIG